MRIPRALLARIPSIYFVIFLTGCAKTGDPQPPLVLVPRPATDLAARQIAGRILLTVSMPSENTDGSPATGPVEVEILRVIEDRSGRTTPLTQEEFISQASTLSLISFENVAAYREGDTLHFRDELDLPDRSLIYTRSFCYSIRFINEKRQTAGTGNPVCVTPVAIPGPPTDLSFQLGQEYVRIRWQGPAANDDGSLPPRIAGYNLYRSEDPRKFPIVPLNKELIQAPEFEDREFQFDKTYYYAAAVVGSRENPYAESLPSAPLFVPTKDTFPPSAPQNLQAVFENRIALLFWTAPPERDVAGYRIYRGESGGTESRLLNLELQKIPSFRDEQAAAGKRYDYRVTAVDPYGNESPPATTSLDIP